MKKKVLVSICLSLIIVASVVHPSMQAYACEHCEPTAEYPLPPTSPSSAPIEDQGVATWQETMNTEGAMPDERYTGGAHAASHADVITDADSPSVHSAETTPDHSDHTPDYEPDHASMEDPCRECETIHDSIDNLFIENRSAVAPYGPDQSIVREYWSGPVIGYKKAHSRTIYCTQGHRIEQATR